jgi:methyl-accepting chemotaxis protein
MKKVMDQNTNCETLVARSYPYRFALLCTAIFVCSMLLTSFAIWLYLYSEPAPSYAENYAMLARLRNEITFTSLIVYSATSLFALAGTMIISLLYSHKVAGPLYKLGVYLRRVASGDFTGSIILRQGDVIRHLADDVNTLISSYRSAVSELEIEADALGDAASRIKEAAHPMSREDLHKVLDPIATKTDEIENILHTFRL